MANDNPKTAEEYFKRGDKRRESGDLDGAIEDYTESFRLEPNNVSSLNNRGAVYSVRGEYDKAIRDLNEVIRQRPDDVLALTNRGNSWIRKGEYDKALQDLNEAIRLKPDFVFAWANRGITWSSKDEHDKAIHDFNEAIRLNPSDVLAWVNRSVSWGAKGEHDKAIDDLNEAARLDPKSAEIFNNRGSVWGAKGENDKAIDDFSEAIRLKPDNVLALTNRGNSWIRKGEYDKALQDLGEAIRLDPTFQGAIYNRTFALALQFSESKHKEITEKLQKEYSEQLETAIEQSTKDTTKLHDEAQDSMRQSKDLRNKAVNLLKFTIWGWIGVVSITYLIDLCDNKIDPYLFLTWLPAFTMISTPVFALVWFYGKESDKIKNQADKSQRSATFKEILRHYGGDESFRKELLKHSLAQESRSGDSGGSDSLPAFLPDAMTKGVKTMSDTINKPNAE